MVVAPLVRTSSGSDGLVVSISTFTSARSSGTMVTRAMASRISTVGAAAAALAAQSAAAAADERDGQAHVSQLPNPNSWGGS